MQYITMLQYPKGIANSDNAFYKNRKIIFMAINGQSLVDRGKYYYDTKNNTFQGDGSEEARCLITLPMPNNLQDEQRHNWSETDYMSALSNVVSLGGAEAPSTNAPAHSASSGMGMRFNILGKINEIASVASDALGVRKPMLNPGYFQNYTGSGLRNFNFSYDFIPKNSDEALQITKIVQAFKQYSSPQKGLHVTGSSEIDKYIYQAEDEYTLNPAKSSDFRFGTNSAIEEALSDIERHTYSLGSGSKFSPFQMSPYVWHIVMFNDRVRELSQIYTCACTDVSVQYSSGKFDTFEDGMPKMITLSLSFAEMDLQFYDKYATANLETQSNNTTASMSFDTKKDQILRTKNDLLPENVPMSANVAGNMKSANLIPPNADGKKDGLLDTATMNVNDTLKSAKANITEVTQSVKESLVPIRETINEARSTVEMIAQPIRETLNEVDAVKNFVKSAINRAVIF